MYMYVLVRVYQLYPQRTGVSRRNNSRIITDDHEDDFNP